MVKKVILTMLLSMVIVLMVGTVAFAAPPNVPPASCAAHCATFFGGSGSDNSVSAQAKRGEMGGPDGTAQMGNCGSWEALCCANWVEKFSR